ncbi:MAG: hypothetical protein N2316_12580 [Spirochaetes bacterium]|nr:hypothetical protein [Spirochaetota bacterium]
MSGNKIIIMFNILLLMLFTSCNDKELEKFKSVYSKKGDESIDYFYKNIMKNKNYNLLKKFLLEEFNMYDPEDSEVIYWVGNSNNDTINWIVNKNEKYGKFIKYEIMNKRFFYAKDEDTFNIVYKLEVRYEKATAKEIIILGFLRKGPDELKLIAYSSRLK